MATNAPAGDGHRNGAVRKRSQLKTKIMGEEHYTKRDKDTGQFMDQKADDGKFKGVRKEHELMQTDAPPTRKPAYRDIFTGDRTRRTPVILSDGTSVEYPAGWSKAAAKQWRKSLGLLKPA